MKTKQLVQIAFLGTLLYVVQVGLSFIPNIELVSFLILIYTLVFPNIALPAIGIFILLEGLHWGFGLWWWSYIYVWPILYFLVKWLKRSIKPDDVLSWSIVLGFYGLIFGLLFALAYIPVSFSYAFSYFVSGIFFDIIHGIGNFIICLFLLKPTYTVFIKINQNSR